MTSIEWHYTTDPHRMLSYLSVNSPLRHHMATDYRLYMYCLNCCYGVDDDLGKDAQLMIDGKMGVAKRPGNWAMGWAGDQSKPNRAERANYLRDIIGNPFVGEINVQIRSPRAARLLQIAESQLDYCAVADILEEDGYDNQDLLQHFRGYARCRCQPNCSSWVRFPLSFQHVRGCWAKTLIIGQS